MNAPLLAFIQPIIAEYIFEKKTCGTYYYATTSATCYKLGIFIFKIMALRTQHYIFIAWS